MNVHDSKNYKMLNCNKTNRNIPYNVVFASQFAHLLVQYQQHPEAKSLAPDGTACAADTQGLLQRAHVIAGEIRYVGKETDHKWEEGEDPSILEFKATEYGRKAKVVASEDVKARISSIGINKCARESGFDQKNFIGKLVRGLPVKRQLPGKNRVLFRTASAQQQVFHAVDLIEFVCTCPLKTTMSRSLAYAAIVL